MLNTGQRTATSKQHKDAKTTKLSSGVNGAPAPGDVEPILWSVDTKATATLTEA